MTSERGVEMMTKQSLRRGFPVLVLAAIAAASVVPAAAMSADSSGYAVVVPWVASETSNTTVETTVWVENHSPSPAPLVAYYVGEKGSQNPGLLVCSDRQANPVPQRFTLEVPAGGVLQFGLQSLLSQKCRGWASAPGSVVGDRGTLTIFTPVKQLQRISVVARVATIPSNAVSRVAVFHQDGLPLAALEGNTQIVSGLSHGPNARVDCLVSSFYDATASGDLYEVRALDSSGGVMGSKRIQLKAWSSEYLADVYSIVGAGGAVVDAGRVEIVPAANKTRPSIVSSCQVVDPTGSAPGRVAFHVGRLYEPLDLLRKRRVDVSSTPGSASFEFTPGKRRLHAVFLRAPDLVECSVSDARLMIEVMSPDGRYVTGWCGRTGEFYTGHRGEVGMGEAGAWGIEISECRSDPPNEPVPYSISCVSGNGMSQVDNLLP